MRMAGIEDTAELLEKQLAAELSKMTLEEALSLARAFSHYLNLTGIAETHHRYNSYCLLILFQVKLKNNVLIVVNVYCTNDYTFWISHD